MPIRVTYEPPAPVVYIHCTRCGKQVSPPVSYREDLQSSVSLRCECPPKETP